MSVVPFRKSKIDREINWRENLIEEYLERFESEETKRSYGSTLREFFKVKDIKEIMIDMISSIGVLEIQKYIKMLKRKGLSSKTIRTKISALSSFWSYTECISNEEIENVFDGKSGKSIKNLMRVILDKENNEEFHGKILDKKEIEKIYDRVKESKNKEGKENKESKRNSLILKLMLNTAIRVEEVEKIRWNNFKEIKSEEEKIEWYLEVKGKGRKIRLIWINEELVQLLKEYGEEIGFVLGKSDWFVFGIKTSMIYKIVKEFCEVNPHSLRKTAITEAIQKGVLPQDVMDYAGHSDWKTTLRYFKMVNRLENNAARSVRL